MDLSSRPHRNWPSIIGSPGQRASRGLSRLEDITRLISEWAWETDPEGRITHVSDRVTEVLGFIPLQLIGKSFAEIGTFLNDADEERDVNWQNPFRDVQFLTHDSDGKERLFLISGIPFYHPETWSLEGTSGTAEDITQRKKAENVLRRQTYVTEKAEQIAKYGHWMWDVVNDVCLHCSEGMAALHGVSVDEYMKLASLPDFDQTQAHPDEREMIAAVYKDMKETGQSFTIDFQVEYPTGVQWVREIGSPMDISDTGEVLTSVGITYDITEFKRLDRMKSEFISTVSHELRTPLTSIVGALGLARSGSIGDLSDNLSSMLDIAYDNSKRLVQLTDDILDLEKIIADNAKLNITPVDLGTLLNDGLTANKGYGDVLSITFTADAMKENLSVDGDRNRLMQVLSNFMSNAAKFSSAGETVVISAVQQGDNACIFVKGTGCGIPPEYQDRVFDKFTQVDVSDNRQIVGSGLGLSICQAIIDQHGGTIGLESEVGVGSTFFFILPLST